MQHLGIKKDDLTSLGAINTAREIAQQPALWLKIWNKIAGEQQEIKKFVEIAKQADKVILTGAGTSAFIGESLTGAFHRNFHGCTEAVSTTHLVSHPYDYLSRDQTILLVSFARSGNSPESKAAVALADDLSKKCHHLIITCNPDGDLANYQSNNGQYIFQLPPESNDKSLAMTSSYTGMLLSALLIARLPEIDALKTQVELVGSYADRILNEELDTIRRIAKLPFKRAVFLGSGPLYGTAMESHLKLQELTDGNIICKHDSFLGFRHGPKAVVDGETLIIYNLSNDAYVSRYEHDLVQAMDKGKKALAQVAIAETSGFDLPVDYRITFTTDDAMQVDEEFLALPGVIPNQLLGFFKSLEEGLKPDSPSQSGAISRVVKGVNIYSLNS